MEHAAEPRATGRCLCGSVTYEVRGPLRDVVLCHCEECQRWGGYLGAFASTRRTDLVLAPGASVRWVESPGSDRHARRGFCGDCGSSLFWEPADSGRISIAAGTLDPPTGLRVAGHWYTSQSGDYYELEDDLPRDTALDFDAVRWS